MFKAFTRQRRQLCSKASQHKETSKGPKLFWNERLPVTWEMQKKKSLQNQERAARTATGNYNLLQGYFWRTPCFPKQMLWPSVPLLGLIVSRLRLLSRLLLLLTARPQEAQELLLYIHLANGKGPPPTKSIKICRCPGLCMSQ